MERMDFKKAWNMDLEALIKTYRREYFVLCGGIWIMYVEYRGLYGHSMYRLERTSSQIQYVILNVVITMRGIDVTETIGLSHRLAST